jgi:hypothetical protein
MSILNPAAAWWLLLIPALILLYIFRPRSVRLNVSSLRLWEKLPQVDRPRARLRRPPLSLLLLLQLLLLIAGIFALLQPAAETPEGRHYLFLLDASGSMQAANDGMTRFARAKEEASQILAGMRDLDRATLLRIGPNVTTYCSLCTRPDAERALADMRAGAGRADMSSALSLAAGLAGREDSGHVEVVVISDGGFEEAVAAPLPPLSRFIPVGRDTNNRGVTQLSARRSPDARPGYAVYARVDNSGASRVNLRVEAFADTVPMPERAVTLEPGDHADLTWQAPAGALRFTVNVSPGDSLRADDTASIFLPQEGQHRVAVIADSTELYRRLIAGVPGLSPVVATTPENAAFTIVEGTLPTTPTVGGLLLVNPQGQDFTSTGEVKDVRPVAAGAGHPLLEGVDLAALLVREAPILQAPAWLEPIVVSTAGTPLVLAGERQGQRVVVLAFDPDDSNLPKLAAFPLLFANAVDWLYPLAAARAIEPGESLYLPPGYYVLAPGERGLRVGESGIFSETDEAGVYEVSSPRDQVRAPDLRAEPLRFAVNMTGAGETDLRVASHPELDRQSAALDERTTKQEFWPPLAAFALALLGLEWLVYCWRRGRV